MKITLSGLILAIQLVSPTSLIAEEEITRTANDFVKAADNCLLDVRDNQIKYKESRHCNELGRLHLKYLNNGGHEKNTPLELELKVSNAIGVAWSARAVSISGDPSISLW